ncbi:uncharacterized protein LOC107965179 [Apis mellifera]|uniref:Uncharacterized protein LOC107965179 n=1 Tax=Apis mellifera TaxID=7460 RepID=A0A7M7M559_APIME|nr:uncharacterized protein LOC107965179 [Apis mellifera]XP_026299595.1 uncharacterized protein LOC107965179 [Apis mellifera]|eukprot:XP_016770392.1 uncharacterized protein LOC107965179 [Apis mellifera]
MGGPGAGRVNRHELNAVPKSDVGHGDRTLVIDEPTAPAPACRCHPASDAVISASGQHLVPAQLPPSPPPLASLHIDNANNCSSIGNNNNNTTAKSDAISNGTKAAATMSSPPKHRRGFDPNDVNATDYRRYRRVKTRRGFVCSTP